MWPIVLPGVAGWPHLMWTFIAPDVVAGQPTTCSWPVACCLAEEQVCGWECCWGVIVVVVIEDGTWVTLCHLLPCAGDAHTPAAYCFSLLQPAAMQHVAPVPAVTSACVCWFPGCCVFAMDKESGCGFWEIYRKRPDCPAVQEWRQVRHAYRAMLYVMSACCKQSPHQPGQ